MQETMHTIGVCIVNGMRKRFLISSTIWEPKTNILGSRILSISRQDFTEHRANYIIIISDVELKRLNWKVEGLRE